MDDNDIAKSCRKGKRHFWVCFDLDNGKYFGGILREKKRWSVINATKNTAIGRGSVGQ